MSPSQTEIEGIRKAISTGLSDLADGITMDETSVSAALVAIAQSITYNFHSPNELDSNLESANVVDGLFAIARALQAVADALVGDD